jgi:hypothetical protein
MASSFDSGDFLQPRPELGDTAERDLCCTRLGRRSTSGLSLPTGSGWCLEGPEFRSRTWPR